MAEVDDGGKGGEKQAVEMEMGGVGGGKKRSRGGGTKKKARVLVLGLFGSRATANACVGRALAHDQFFTLAAPDGLISGGGAWVVRRVLGRKGLLGCVQQGVHWQRHGQEVQAELQAGVRYHGRGGVDTGGLCGSGDAQGPGVRVRGRGCAGARCRRRHESGELGAGEEALGADFGQWAECDERDGDR